MTETGPADSPGAPRQEPRRFGLGRRVLFRAIEETARLLGGRAFYRAAYLAAGRFRERVERVAVPDLPTGLEGFRVAQLSDLHAGSFLGSGDLAAVVDAVNAREPDLVCLTGDLITRRWSEALLLLEDLRRLRPRHGALAVFGNHDYHDRAEGRIVEAFAEHGIRFLRNDSRRVDTGDGALTVVGLEDLEEGKVVDVEAARAGLRAGDVELVLCHNPLGAPSLARPGCCAVLSGHTHGHQVDLPGIRNIAPTHPGDRVDLGETACITSRGLGAVGIPIRVASQAEVVWLELTRSAG